MQRIHAGGKLEGILKDWNDFFTWNEKYAMCFDKWIIFQIYISKKVQQLIYFLNFHESLFVTIIELKRDIYKT